MNLDWFFYDCVVLPKDAHQERLFCAGGWYGQGFSESWISEIRFRKTAASIIEKLDSEAIIAASDSEGSYGANTVDCSSKFEIFGFDGLRAVSGQLLSQLHYADEQAIKSACGPDAQRPSDAVRDPPKGEALIRASATKKSIFVLDPDKRMISNAETGVLVAQDSDSESELRFAPIKPVKESPEHHEKPIAAAPPNPTSNAARFISVAVGSLFDPLALIGYLVAGIAIRRIWEALTLAAAWAFTMEVVVTLLAGSSQLNYAFGEHLLARMFWALLFTGLVFYIANLIRRPRSSVSEQSRSASSTTEKAQASSRGGPEAIRQLLAPQAALSGRGTVAQKERSFGTLSQSFWLRVACVASVAWIGVLIILSVVSRDFDWIEGYRNEFGPASISALVGVALIFAVCLGIPWIAQAAEKNPSATPGPLKPSGFPPVDADKISPATPLHRPNSDQDARAKKALALIQKAIRNVHPERFVIPDDRALECQPQLVSLNRVLGKDDERRFSPASYEQLVMAIQKYEETGYLSQVCALALDNDILLGLITAAAYEVSLRQRQQSHDDQNKGAEIQAGAKFVLDRLNDYAKQD